MICTRTIIRPGNKTHKILWDFERHTDNPILTRRPELEIAKNILRERSCHIEDAVVKANHTVKIKKKKKKKKANERQGLGFRQATKMVWNMKVTVTAIVIGSFGAQKHGKSAGRVKNRRTS